MSTRQLNIAGRVIGAGMPPYLIAEIGINHGGDVDLASRMLAAAAEAGADAVKLQTFCTERFLAKSSAYYDVLDRARLSAENVRRLQKEAKARNVVLFASVFDEESVELWESLDAPAYKIASGDITHLPLLHRIAQTGKPVIVSTGGASVQEISEAIAALQDTGVNPPIALLHCVSHYPMEPAEANLACMATLRERFHVPVGFSDHSLGRVLPIAAVALGAEIIEKHFTLDSSLPGPDHALSADPADLCEIAMSIQATYAAIGRPIKEPVEKADHIAQIRRSLTANEAIPAGRVLTRSMVAVKRPGVGLAPVLIDQVVGRRARRDIAADETLSLDMLTD